ncbi:MAG: hypothetical protein ACOCRX_05625 [Candidatus Woesearchaeota archaeon]
MLGAITGGLAKAGSAIGLDKAAKWAGKKVKGAFTDDDKKEAKERARSSADARHTSGEQTSGDSQQALLDDKTYHGVQPMQMALIAAGIIVVMKVID